MSYRVALWLSPTTSFYREVLDGIIDHHRRHTHWHISYWPYRPLPWEDSRADGVIAAVSEGEILRAARAVQRRRTQIVNISSGLQRAIALPSVISDDLAVGRLAGEALVARGLSRVIYVENRQRHYSHDRREGCRAAVAAADGKVCVCSHDARGDVPNQVRRLGTPVGVFACNDQLARQVMDLCIEAGLVVPDEVAVLGVDNDEMLCELSVPALASVQMASRTIGQRAAALLDHLMAGGDPPDEPERVPPEAVIVRRSLDTWAIDDDLVATAVRQIRAPEGVDVSVRELLRGLPVSRRTLEVRFKAALGHSPQAEIGHARLQRARTLLAATDLSIGAVAARSGFSSAPKLAAAFRRAFNQTPTAFRRSVRGVASAAGSTGRSGRQH